MPELEIRIGGRAYRVACAPGGETALQVAANRLDAEATTLREQLGGVPEATLLLMSGLMLADRVAELQADREALVSEIAAASRRPAPERQVERVVERVEVPVIPDTLTQTLADLAMRAETLAQALEQRLPLAIAPVQDPEQG